LQQQGGEQEEKRKARTTGVGAKPCVGGQPGLGTKNQENPASRRGLAADQIGEQKAS